MSRNDSKTASITNPDTGQDTPRDTVQDVALDAALENDIRQAVASGDNVKEMVRQITLKALTRRELDLAAIRRVARSVVAGARQGATDRGPDIKDALGKAVSGLDDALSKAAEATKLALQEATSRGDDFSAQELKRTLKDVQTLEQMFVETLRDAARGGKDQVHHILADLADHARHSGTAVGAQIRESMADLIVHLASAGKSGVRTGVKSAKTTASLMARMASGMLEGVADSLHPKQPERKSRASGDSPPKRE